MYAPETSVIILASGSGSRLGELTRNKPKPLHSFDGKPYLGRVVDSLLKKQFNDIVITVSFHHQQIEEFVQQHYNGRVRTVREPQVVSTVHSAKYGLMAVQHEHAIIMTADNMWDVNLHDLLHQHYQTRADATVMVTGSPTVPNAGKVRVAQNKEHIVQMWPLHNEKSDIPPTRPASTMGMYVVRTASLLASIRPGDTGIEREPIGRLKRIVPYWNEGFFFDYGTPDNYSYLLQHPELIARYVTNA